MTRQQALGNRLAIRVLLTAGALTLGLIAVMTAEGRVVLPF